MLHDECWNTLFLLLEGSLINCGWTMEGNSESGGPVHLPGGFVLWDREPGLEGNLT